MSRFAYFRREMVHVAETGERRGQVSGIAVAFFMSKTDSRGSIRRPRTVDELVGGRMTGIGMVFVFFLDSRRGDYRAAILALSGSAAGTLSGRGGVRRLLGSIGRDGPDGDRL